MFQHAVIHAYFGLYRTERYGSVNNVSFTYGGIP